MHDQPLVLVSAIWNRTPANKEDTLAAWRKGKDFRIIGSRGAYCSIRDIESLRKDFSVIVIQYAPHLYVAI